ncbi:MAG: dienelactone hydrolase family protein [Polyangiaceae bacterium]|nr:dienelactone hydrolase family protein [Polyangiaceae bacterium]
MYEPIKFAKTGGGDATGELVAPEGEGKAPGVVLIQEWWGLNGQIRHVAAKLAREGFVVAIPDLYHGRWTTDAGEAQQLMTALDWSVAVAELGGAAAFLQNHPRCSGNVGVMGFCLGGALTFATAATSPDVKAAVAYYGLASQESFDHSKIKAPMLAHFASKDDWASPDKAKALVEAMNARGQSIELHIYEAGHAFANEGRKDVYVPDAAALSWSRTTAFLHKHLG